MQELLTKDNPILRQKAEPILLTELGADWLKDLAQGMIAIMQEKGAVGIAAPQIGISKRVIAFGTAYAKHRKPEVDIVDTVLINPSFTALDNNKESQYEGCLNCGDLRGMVPRFIEVEYSGYTLDGDFFIKKASGLEARIIQHEIDHLNGHLFLDWVEEPDSLITFAKLKVKMGY